MRDDEDNMMWRVYTDPRMIEVREETYLRRCDHVWLVSAILGTLAGIVIGIGIVCLMI